MMVSVIQDLACRYWDACRRMRSDSEPDRVAGLSALGALLPMAPAALANAIHRTLREEGPARVLPFSPRSQARSAAARA